MVNMYEQLIVDTAILCSWCQYCNEFVMMAYAGVSV